MIESKLIGIQFIVGPLHYAVFNDVIWRLWSHLVGWVDSRCARVLVLAGSCLNNNGEAGTGLRGDDAVALVTFAREHGTALYSHSEAFQDSQ